MNNPIMAYIFLAILYLFVGFVVGIINLFSLHAREIWRKDFEDEHFYEPDKNIIDNILEFGLNPIIVYFLWPLFIISSISSIILWAIDTLWFKLFN